MIKCANCASDLLNVARGHLEVSDECLLELCALPFGRLGFVVSPPESLSHRRYLHLWLRGDDVIVLPADVLATPPSGR